MYSPEPQTQSLRQILQKTSKHGLLIVQDWLTRNTVWIYLDERSEKYNLDAFDLDVIRYVKLSEIERRTPHDSGIATYEPSELHPTNIYGRQLQQERQEQEKY